MKTKSKSYGSSPPLRSISTGIKLEKKKNETTRERLRGRKRAERRDRGRLNRCLRQDSQAVDFLLKEQKAGERSTLNSVEKSRAFVYCGAKWVERNRRLQPLGDLSSLG